MGLFSNLFRLNIEWADDTRDTLVYKYPFKNNGKEVNNKSSLTVRESQVAVFVHKGQIADVFTPGVYSLETEILPVLTKLASWKYKFETPITVDVYFINTKQFTDIKWGTKNPFIMRDPEFGVVRVRGFGSFSFKVDDAAVFLRELFGTNSSFKTDDIEEFLKTMVISGLTDAIGESKISALDLAGNTMEFQTIITAKIQELFSKIGLKLVTLLIENMSVPSEVEKALDERAKLGILGGATDTMLKVAAAEAMKDAAKNPGMGGAFMSAGVGVGAGTGLGGIMAGAFNGSNNANNGANNASRENGNANAQEGTMVCPGCGKNIKSSSKFCPDCGQKIEAVKKFCPDCGTQVTSLTKFCPNCGKKLQ